MIPSRQGSGDRFISAYRPLANKVNLMNTGDLLARELALMSDVRIVSLHLAE
jgi:hypothetical protein